MASIFSDPDPLLFGIPLGLAVAAGFFRLDELFSHSRSKPEVGTQLSAVDAEGRVLCVDPDGRAFGRNGEEIGRMRRRVRPAGTRNRVVVEWYESSKTEGERCDPEG